MKTLSREEAGKLLSSRMPYFHMRSNMVQTFYDLLEEGVTVGELLDYANTLAHAFNSPVTALLMMLGQKNDEMPVLHPIHPNMEAIEKTSEVAGMDDDSFHNLIISVNKLFSSFSGTSEEIVPKYMELMPSDASNALHACILGTLYHMQMGEMMEKVA